MKLKNWQIGLIVGVVLVIMVRQFIGMRGASPFEAKPVHILPAPDSIVIHKDSFVLSRAPAVLLRSTDARATAVAIQLQDLLGKATGKRVPLLDSKMSNPPAGVVLLEMPDGLDFGAEGYRMEVFPDRIEMQASTAAGLFYAVQSLRQLLPDYASKGLLPEVLPFDPGFAYGSPEQRQMQSPPSVKTVSKAVVVTDSVVLPCLEIIDGPAFEWRGLLLDCSRHFMEPAYIKRTIDLLAVFKMNTLHWHLVDDQGWRLPVDNWPELTHSGAWRREADGRLYGGYYSHDEIKDILDYAAARFVNVVPEIEMPGHSMAALTAYPEFSCTGGPFEVPADWGVFKDVLCIGDERTYAFVCDVLDQTMELFPSEFIHIGGDESPVVSWRGCKRCQTRMNELELEDEHELQAWFIGRVSRYLESKGKSAIGWGEILDGVKHEDKASAGSEVNHGPSLAKNAIVQSWQSFEAAIEAVGMGHRSIVSPTSHAYFDYGIDAIDVKKVFSFNPVPANLPEHQQQLILGGECNMWSEHAPQPRVDSKIFPRLTAMSEVLWSGPSKRDWASFYADLQAIYGLLDTLGVTYGPEAEPVRFEVEWNAGGPEPTLACSLIPGSAGLKINYQLNGSQQSKTYDAPIILATGDHELKVQAFRNQKPYGTEYVRNYSVHMASALPLLFDSPYKQAYTGGRDGALTDGRLGTIDFRDGIWQAWQGDDMAALIDLEQLKQFSQVSLQAYQYINSWIFLPTTVELWVGEDADNMQLISTTKPVAGPKMRGKFIESFQLLNHSVNGRYIRIVARNIRSCPPWHEAAGSSAWLFIDEITVQ